MSKELQNIYPVAEQDSPESNEDVIAKTYFIEKLLKFKWICACKVLVFEQNRMVQNFHTRLYSSLCRVVRNL